MALAVTVLAALAIIDRSQLLPIVLLFVIVVPFEKLFPRHRQALRRPGLGTDLTYALALPVLRIGTAVVGAVVAVASLVWLPGLLMRPLVELLPNFAKTLVDVAVFDLAAYWGHRWSHEVPFLWRIHVIHHSSERLDWLSGIRVHPLDGLVLAPVFGFLVVAGFSPRVTGALALIQLAVGVFLHANVRWRLRPLQRVVSTPEFHHWHHANEPDALNRNFSALLPVWDLIFGTYFMPERRPQVYGTAVAVPAPFLAQLHHPFKGGRTLRQIARHPVFELRSLGAGLKRGSAQLVEVTRFGSRARFGARR
jgi:sterol desaturase/sphingolipid hydroxylase (fatty acid hydroxylase superfamily)